jgi:hypothetical protein
MMAVTATITNRMKAMPPMTGSAKAPMAAPMMNFVLFLATVTVG